MNYQRPHYQLKPIEMYLSLRQILQKKKVAADTFLIQIESVTLQPAVLRLLESSLRQFI